MFLVPCKSFECQVTGKILRQAASKIFCFKLEHFEKLEISKFNYLVLKGILVTFYISKVKENTC